MKITDETILTEIRIKYKNWVDVGILCQLYSQTRQEILEIVKDVKRLPVSIEDRSHSFRAGNRTREELEVLYERIQERYDAGEYDSQICKNLHCSSSAVSRWRHLRHLPANKYTRSKEI